MGQIAGVQLTPLTQIGDERGKVMHVLKGDKELLSTIEDIYCSVAYPGKAKAWKLHTLMTQQLVVPQGSMRFVLYDARKESESYQTLMELCLGEENYQRLCIPPNIWYGFSCISEQPALIINTPDLSHDPDEVLRLPDDSPDIPYSWEP